MTHFGIVFIPIVAAISLTGSIFILRYVYKCRSARQEIETANPPTDPVSSKTKTKSTMRDKLYVATYFITIFLLTMIARILRLPIPEILLSTFFSLVSLFFLRHLFLWHKAKKLGCAIQVGCTPTAFLVAVISFGLLFGSVGAVMLHFDLVKQQRCSQFTQAVIVDHLKRSPRASSHSYNYFAVIEFYANRQTIHATSDMGWPDPRYKIGKDLIIRYNPHDTQEFLIKGERNIAPAIFLFFELFFCVGIPILIFTQFDGKRLRQIKSSK